MKNSGPEVWRKPLDGYFCDIYLSNTRLTEAFKKLKKKQKQKKRKNQNKKTIKIQLIS